MLCFRGFTGLFSLLLLAPSIGAQTTTQSLVQPTAPAAPAASPGAATAPTAPAVTPAKKLELLKAQYEKQKTLSRLLEYAQELYNQGQYGPCSDELWKHVQVLNIAGLTLLTKAHVKAKQYTEGLKAAQLLLAKGDRNAEAHYLMAMVKLIREKEKDADKEALQSLKRATEVDSDYEPALDELVKIYEKRKNFYEVRIIFQDLVEHHGPQPKYINKLCEINAKDGMNDQGLEFCQKAIMATPEMADNYVYMGIIHKNLRETDKAKEKLKAAATRFPKSELALKTYGDFSLDNKNSLEAYNSFSTCTKSFPESEDCLMGFAQAAYEIQKPDEAFTAAKKACIMNRKNAVVARRASQYYKTTKQYDWQEKFRVLAEQCSI